MLAARYDRPLDISKNSRLRYFENLTQQISLLREAMEASDFATISDICQRVRGSAALFGLNDLGDACTWMEQACGENRLKQIVDCFQVIEVLFDRHLMELKA